MWRSCKWYCYRTKKVACGQDKTGSLRRKRRVLRWRPLVRVSGQVAKNQLLPIVGHWRSMQRATILSRSLEEDEEKNYFLLAKKSPATEPKTKQNRPLEWDEMRLDEKICWRNINRLMSESFSAFVCIMTTRSRQVQLSHSLPTSGCYFWPPPPTPPTLHEFLIQMNENATEVCRTQKYDWIAS